MRCIRSGDSDNVIYQENCVFRKNQSVLLIQFVFVMSPIILLEVEIRDKVDHHAFQNFSKVRL